MNNEFLQNLMANNIQILEDFYKKDKPNSNDMENDFEESNNKKDVKTIVLDWVSLNNKENEKFLKLEAKAERIKNGEEDSDDENYDSDSSYGSDDESEVSNEDDTQSLNDEDENENENILTEKEKLEKHDRLVDKQEKENDEDEEKVLKFDELSKYYCYRILIEFVRELKNIEDKIGKNLIEFGEEEERDYDDYVYRRYEHDEVDDINSFSYQMTNNKIAIKSKLENESYISFLIFCFELVFDDKSNKLNNIRQHIIDTLTDFDSTYIARIKKLKNLNVQNWFTLIEDSMAIPIGDFVKFEFNFDKTKIIEKTRYDFDENITEENI